MILVTGGTGLVGAYLLLELTKENDKIVAIKREKSTLKGIENLFAKNNALDFFGKIEWRNADLLDQFSLEESLAGITTVYHAAGFVSFDERKSKQILETNVEGTKNLVNLCIEGTVENLVHFSSIAVLNDKKKELFFSEDSEWNNSIPRSTYAFSKKLAEIEVWRGSEEGLNVLVLQPGVIIGSLDGNRESEKILKLAKRKQTITPPGSTGFIDVRDVVKIAIHLTKNKNWKENFVLITENLSYTKIIQDLRSKIGNKPAKIASKTLLKFVFYLTKISKLFGGKSLSKASFNALTNKDEFSNRKLKEFYTEPLILIQKSILEHYQLFNEI